MQQGRLGQVLDCNRDSWLPVPKNTNLGRLGILRGLRDALEENSKDHLLQELRESAAYYFGSLPKAIAALKTERKILGGWSKARITAALLQIRRAKERLDYVAARRDHGALVSAAEAYFGSWGRALHAAGIDPNLYFVNHQWRKLKARDKT